MTARRISALFAFSVFALSGCADFGGPISGSSNQVLSPEERRLQELENKTAQIMRRLDALNSSGLDQETTRLRDEVRGLRGDIEKLRFDSDNRERAAREMYQDLERRLQAAEGGTVAPGAVMAPAIGGGAVSGSSPGTISAVTPQQSKVASPEEEAAYLSTFDLLKNGRSDEAVRGFRSMLDKWPQGRYADNAWYWMGEAYFLKREYAPALSSFQSLIDKFSTSAKVPEALLKVGLSGIELKRNGEARAALQRLVRDFPNSNAASLARQKLEQLGG